jgi:hypothetical protein
VVKVAAAAEGTVGRSVGPQCPDHFFFVCYEIFFTESHIGLSAKIHREEDRQLSSKRPSTVQCPPRGLHREQTLGEGFGERKGFFAERNPTLGEDLESGSESQRSSSLALK